METVTNAIEVDHLTKKFGDFVAVDDVSFNVAHQEIFGLLGPNGAGKTTLIRMMTTLLAVTSGTARIGGHDIRTDADGVRNTLGVIPQAFTSDPELTAKENMAIHAKLYGVPSDKRDALIDGLLESVELLKFRDSLVRTFSGGMRRRLEIARGLVHSPKIMFLDEPTTGLDPVSRAHVWEMIRSLRDRSELTILLTTHYMDEADKLCDRIAIVDHGKLAALDTPTRLKDNVPGAEIVEAEFEGEPPRLDRATSRPGTRHGRNRARRIDAHHLERRPGDCGRADGPGTGTKSDGKEGVGAEHDARRCVPALYGQRAARCAAEGDVCSRARFRAERLGERQQ